MIVFPHNEFSVAARNSAFSENKYFCYCTDGINAVDIIYHVSKVPDLC